MRRALTSLIVLAGALAVVPVSTVMSAASVGAEEAERTERAGSVSVRDRVIELTNVRRRAHGCNNLRRNAALSSAAQTHSRKMANQNTMSHQLPGEAPLGVRVRRAGYNWTMVGENVAYFYATPAAVVRAWMNSRSHRRNILNCRYQHIGVGYAVSDRGLPYWTQVFGRR